jgi:hypothetical protein
MSVYAHAEYTCGKESSAGMILREKSLGGGYLCEQNCFALTIAVYSIWANCQGKPASALVV